MEDLTVIIISNFVYFTSKIFFKDFDINKVGNVSLLDYKLNEDYNQLSPSLKILVFILKYTPYLLFLSVLLFLIFNEDKILGNALNVVKFTLFTYTLYYLFFLRKNIKAFFKVFIKILGSCGRMTELVYIFLLK